MCCFNNIICKVSATFCFLFSISLVNLLLGFQCVDLGVRFIYVDYLIVEGDVPEEEILSILDVPPGKMGRIIGRRGSSILAIKESCKYIYLFLLSV